MKNLLGKLAVMLIFCSLIFIDGCKKNHETPPYEPEFAFLKDLNQERLKEADPEILALIREDLIKKDKINLAKRLSNTYDLHTGKLHPKAFEHLRSTAKDRQAKTTSVTWHMVWYAQNTSSADIGGETYPDATGTVLIGAPTHWIRGFKIVCPTTYPYSWSQPNSFCYNAADANGGWISSTPVNTWVQSTGWNTEKFDAYWVWVGSQIACYAYYRSLLTDNTTTAWVSNGATCGVHSSGKGIKTIELKIVNLEDCA